MSGFLFYFIGATIYGMFSAISYKSTFGFEMFTDALIIMDDKGEIIYKNTVWDMLDEAFSKELIVQYLKKSVNRKEKDLKTELEYKKEDKTRYYTVNVKRINRRLFAAAKRILILHDNTQNITALELLEEKNQYLQEMNDSIKDMADDSEKLAILSERNSMANEIHDVIGHSLILALNTLESNRLLEDKTIAMQRMKQAVSEINTSFGEINSACCNENLNADAETDFSEKLRSLSLRLKDAGVILEILSVDDLYNVKNNITSCIYRICQESITNAIKHGEADKITISIKKRAGRIEVYIIDNGKGCINIVKGTGLTSMEKRVRKFNGRIFFRSFENQEGFLVRASIPITL